MIGNGLGGVAGDAERYIAGRLFTKHTQACATRHLAALPGIAAGGQVAVDGGGAQLQGTAQVHCRRQGVAPAAGADQAVATAGQQASKTLRHTETALQALALPALKQRRVE